MKLSVDVLIWVIVLLGPPALAGGFIFGLVRLAFRRR
jgi:hypothetical protein